MRYIAPIYRGFGPVGIKGTLWDGSTNNGGLPSGSSMVYKPVYGQGTPYPLSFSKGQLLRLQRAVFKLDLSGSIVNNDVPPGVVLTTTINSSSTRVLTFGSTYVDNSVEDIYVGKSPIVLKERLMGALPNTGGFSLSDIVHDDTVSPSSTTFTSSVNTPVGALPYSELDITIDYAGDGLVSDVHVHMAISLIVLPLSFLLDSDDPTLFWPHIEFYVQIDAIGEAAASGSAFFVSTSSVKNFGPPVATSSPSVVNFLGMPLDLYFSPLLYGGDVPVDSFVGEITTEKFWEFRDADDNNPIYDIDSGAPL